MLRRSTSRERNMIAESSLSLELRKTAEQCGPFRRVLLVNPPMTSIGAEFMMEDVPLRLEYLAAYVRANVDQVEVLDLANGTGRMSAALKRFKPDLVGISINYISTHRNGLAL